jgi:hypothetical protein
MSIATLASSTARADKRSRRPRRSVGTAFALFALILAFVVVCGCVPSSAFAGAAWWRLSARAAPTNLSPSGHGLVEVTANDIGSVGVSGESTPITLTDTLPEGVVVSEPAAVKAHRSYEAENEKSHWNCTVTEQQRRVSCTTAWAVPAFEPLEIEIPVDIQEPAGTVASLPDQFSVQGGEPQDGGGGGTLAGASIQAPLHVSEQSVGFGLEEDGYAIVPEEEGGAPDTRAGSHPFQLTSTLELNQTLEEVQGPHSEKVVYAPAAPALPRDLSFQLPPGVLGNITATGRCTALQFSTQHLSDNLCPAASTIGVATVTLLEPNRLGYITFPVPVFNLEPQPGEPARFGFDADEVPVILDTTVRTGSDYGVSVSVSDATEAAQVLGAQVTFWGTPGAPTHDNSRGWACLREGAENNTGQPCQTPNPHTTTPFLTLPTACTGTLNTSVAGDSWSGQELTEQYVPFSDSLGQPISGLEKCSEVPFRPALDVQPEQPAEEGRPQEHVTSASTPTGLNVDVKVNQQGTLGNEGQLADADVRSTTVALPEGMLLNPGAANGLQACSETQIGYQGPGGTDPFSPGAGEPLHFSTAKAECPDAAKIGSVHIKTPLLNEELSGWVYLATPAPNGETAQNPFNSLVALYIVAENEKLGLTVKLAGKGEIDEQTGQLTTTFQNTPQVPFEELKLQLFGGPRGSLTTPALCGSYTTSTSFTAWSGALAQPQAEPPFQITTGSGGGPCPSNPQPFSPAFQAGSTNQQAGAFTPFSLTLQNPDGDQALQGLTMHLPSGVAALLANVTPCGEPQASHNECGPESLIGHSTAYAGLGPDPVSLQGQVYLTGPYEGAPFGISVVTPAVAGPFNLGDVTVRSRIDVDPNTAAVTIASDPFPTFVKGVPAQIKALNVLVDRPNFEFNPTNCDPTNITGTLTGAQDATANVSSPFQATGCQNLPFKPIFTASTSGNATKANGASFVVKVTSKGLGEADIEKVDLQLPKALPARLTTLQKACTEHAFNTNPASCPEGSVIGTAVIHTPVLKNPLTGPAYLVSHGGAAFPDVEFVLQGENITLVLDGKTAIKNGITYSKFDAAPDAPFTTFETVLPQGPHSALTSNVPANAKFSLCGQTLQMPTEITAHNGALIKQTTKIAVQGCKAVKANRAKKLSRAQQLALALRACRHKYKHSKHRRQTCERQAHKRLGPKKKAHKAHRSR